MAWLKGTIEEFKGGRPKFRSYRKIRTRPDQTWPELHFFKVALAADAGYPESELSAGRTIEFEPDPTSTRPQVRQLKPYQSSAASHPERKEPTRTFLNPYHFVPLAPPPESSLIEASTVLQGTLHDRFDADSGSGPRRYSGRLVCRLETEGPVVLGAEQLHVENDPDREREIQPFGLPDPAAPNDAYRRTPMIPGSTLRGLISAIVEAASCSTLRVLDDRLFQYRDSTRRKFTHTGSLYSAVSTVSPELIPLHSGRSKLTLAERLFGFVEQGGDERALAGRLRFAHALAEGEAPDGGWYEEPVLLKILAEPKGKSPAFYFGNQGYLSKEQLDPTRHSPQGRKFYLHHRKEDLDSRSYESRSPENLKQKAIVRPLKEKTSFLFHIDFTNLSSEELGYLIYSLRPTETFRHKLGMAKPLGLGRVRIDRLALAFIDRRNGYFPAALFGPKYQSLESSLDAGAWQSLSPRLAHRYRYEAAGAALAPAGTFPRMATLVAEIRSAIPIQVRSALELLGNPEEIGDEVIYPLRLDQDSEAEHFKWFVTNDRTKRRPLPPLKPGQGLPALERYEPPPPKRR
jgi:hypothetical protein